MCPPLIYLIAAIALLSSLEAAESIDYAPLGDNYEWTMDASFVSSKGQTASTVIRRKVEGQEVHDGKTYYRMHNWNEGGSSKIDFIDLIRRDDTGVYWIHNGNNGGKEQTYRKLPMNSGQTWEILRRGQPMKIAVIGVDTVTIEGKVYENCFHVRSTSDDAFEDDWEAPNVGNVKSEVVFSNGTKLTLTLKEFKPGK